MKFRKWLWDIEEATRNRPLEGGGGIFDRTTNRGPASQFGGPNTMLPLSIGVDNRAFAGVVDGIGSARSKIRARDGAEPGAASQYVPYEHDSPSHIQTGYMPLQLPLEHQRGSYSHISKGLLAGIKTRYGDAFKNPSLFTMADDNSTLVRPTQEPQTELYTFYRKKGNDPALLDDARNFTLALMQGSFMVRLGKYSHIVNLDRPRIQNRQIMPFPVKDKEGAYADDENPQFYYVMMCSFVFEPKYKDDRFDGDLGSEIDSLLSGRPAPQGGQKRSPPRPSATPRIDPARSPRGRRPTSGM